MNPNEIFKDQKVKNYKKVKPLDHVLLRPGMYCGSLQRSEKCDWVYSFENKTMEKKKILFSSACERIFLEIISNAYDNKLTSEKESTPFTSIVVKMTNSTISIKNDGAAIPTSFAEDEEGKILEYRIPEMIFGQLLTSSNYDDAEENSSEKKDLRTKTGTNGLGSKLANIFSKRFTVIIHNHESGERYIQNWSDNMKIKSEPEIVKLKNIKGYNSKSSTVEIIYELDFKRFGYEEPKIIGDPLLGQEIEGGYDLDTFQLFARHCASVSWCSRTPVNFNNITFDIKNIKEFAKLHFGNSIKNYFIHYEWPEGIEIKTNKRGEKIAVNKKIEPLIEIVLLDTPDKSEQIPYTNSLITREGGTHMDALWPKLCNSIIHIINDKMKQKKNGGKNVKITKNDIKSHVSIIASFVRVPEPQWESQSKTKLTSPDKTFFNKRINISKDSLKMVESWELYSRLLATIEIKSDLILKSTDGKLVKHIGKQTKVTEANYAADRNLEKRMQTIFYLCEGDSASIYLDGKTSYLGRDYIGYMACRGKGLNIFNAKISQIINNKEIKLIKQCLGLIEGTDYSIDSNFNQLRYGKVCVLADSDDDGSHIVGLITLYFFHSFPSLLKRGYLYYEKTPLIRLNKGKECIKFYLMNDYERWKSENDIKGWKLEYFKGLATSLDEHIEDDSKNPIIMRLNYDEECKHYIELAFKKQNADNRKVWISDKNIEIVDFINTDSHNISSFINSQLINYSISTLSRAIPKLMDGLKVSQRKVLYAAFLQWKIRKGKTDYKKYKVSQFQGFISEHTAYPHGEQNLEGTIINMARMFVGTNNISFLEPMGQFGSRINYKKKPSGRYVYTSPRNILSYLFKEEDNDLLEYLYDDGNKIEPSYYLPIIPTVLINGCRGISTGWNTFIPNFNPLQVVDWIIQRLSNFPAEDITHVNPWYFGHKGVIKMIDRRNKKKRNGKVKVITIKGDKEIIQELNDVFNDECTEMKDDTEVKDDTEIDEDSSISEENSEIQEETKKVVTERPLLTMISYGNYYRKSDNTIIITELPIGVGSKDYEDYIDDLISKKKVKTKYSNCTKKNVYLEITGFQGPVNHKTLGLIRSYGMSNMVLLDQNSNPIRYDTQYDILEYFFEERLPFYYKRKNLILEQNEKRCLFLKNKMDFIKLKLDGVITIDNRKESDAIEDMIKNGIMEEYTKELLKMPVGSFVKENVQKISNEYLSLKNELENFKNLPPEELWKNDLEEFREEYIKFNEKETKKLNSDKISTSEVPKKKRYQRKKKLNN